jgi:prepilin-type N-terminal cleavage/methylation domain-containing protein
MAMIFHKLGLINRNQIGFTLIELVIAMAITGVITGAITTTIFQVVNGSARTNNHMTVVREVRSAGYWVSHDAFMAQDVELADESVDDPDGTRFPLTLTWTEWDTNDVHEVVYSITDDELQRTHSKNGTTDASIIVAEFIDTTFKDGKPQTRCEREPPDVKLTLTVMATLGAGSQRESETRTYEIVPRPGS